MSVLISSHLTNAFALEDLLSLHLFNYFLNVPSFGK